MTARTYGDVYGALPAPDVRGLIPVPRHVGMHAKLPVDVVRARAAALARHKAAGEDWRECSVCWRGARHYCGTG